MTFKCSLNDITEVDMTGTSLELQIDEQNSCYRKDFLSSCFKCTLLCIREVFINYSGTIVYPFPLTPLGQNTNVVGNITVDPFARMISCL